MAAGSSSTNSRFLVQFPTSEWNLALTTDVVQEGVEQILTGHVEEVDAKKYSPLQDAQLPSLIASSLTKVSEADSNVSSNVKEIKEVKCHLFNCVPWTPYPLKSKDGLLIELEGNNTVEVFYAQKFSRFRLACGLTESHLVDVLNYCERMDADGGKSRSFFLKTFGGELILKSLKRNEFEKFIEIADEYFLYMRKAANVDATRPIILSKVFGLYKVSQTSMGKKPSTSFVILMENIFRNEEPDFIYDVKGSILGRTIPKLNNKTTLLDGNFVEDGKAFQVSEYSKGMLMDSLRLDTEFLQKLNLMDYSLLVGVHEERRIMTCALIDYLGPYSCDKRLERVAKTLKRCKLPTVVDPKLYRRRIVKFVDAHFQVNPNE